MFKYILNHKRTLLSWNNTNISFQSALLQNKSYLAHIFAADFSVYLIKETQHFTGSSKIHKAIFTR